MVVELSGNILIAPTLELSVVLSFMSGSQLRLTVLVRELSESSKCSLELGIHQVARLQ